ncbi:MAG: signal peptide peptidase SppA [Bacteroidetes bacterium]|nr:signal peptide peptidase SppA [Bacteroidota bacterium]
MRQFFKFFLASVLGFFVSIFLIVFIGVILIAGMVAALGDKSVKPKQNMVLELDLNYSIGEQTIDNPLLEYIDKSGSQPLGLDEILYNIERASKDDNVKGLLIRPGILSAGYGTLEEIAGAIQDFRKSGKFVYAYCEFLSEKNYLIASACDSVFLNPSGNIALDGLSSNVIFYKGLLDKLGVEMELFKVGTHKGAAEVFTQEKLSELNKEQIQRYIDGVYELFCTDVSKNRGVSKDELKRKISNFEVQTPQQALDSKWIDGIWYEDQVADLIKQKTGRSVNEKICFTNISNYRKMSGPNLRISNSKNKIAFVYIDGEISYNNNKESMGQSNCKSLMNTLRKIRYNKDIKALVVRVNSPGGSAYGSDQLWREIGLIKKVKPVIVSMGDVAASGGYYLSAPADTIVVSKYTLTGSIGVFALYPNANAFLKDKLGLSFESVKTGEFADMGMPGRNFSSTERAIIQNGVNNVYNNFTKVVREGRGLDSASVESVAQGKIWIAQDAIQYHLADVVGGIQKAVDIAAYKAGVDSGDYSIIYLPKRDDFTSMFLNMSSMFTDYKLKTQLGDFYPYYINLKSVRERAGMQMYLPISPLLD